MTGLKRHLICGDGDEAKGVAEDGPERSVQGQGPGQIIDMSHPRVRLAHQID